MNDDAEWNALMQDWQSSEAALRPDRLMERVRKDHQRQLLGAVGEVAACALLIALYATLLWLHPNPVLITLAGGTAIFVTVWLTQLFRVMRGTWRAPCATAEECLALTVQRCQARERWLRFVQACLGAVAAFGLAWLPWKLSEDWDVYAAEPWRAVVGVAGYWFLLGLLAVGARRQLRRVRADLARLQALRAAL